MEEFFKNNQSFIAIAIISGIFFSFVSWMFVKKPTGWLKISLIGIGLSCLGLVAMLIPSLLDTVEGDSINNYSNAIMIGIFLLICCMRIERSRNSQCILLQALSC